MLIGEILQMHMGLKQIRLHKDTHRNLRTNSQSNIWGNSKELAKFKGYYSEPFKPNSLKPSSSQYDTLAKKNPSGT